MRQKKRTRGVGVAALAAIAASTAWAADGPEHGDQTQATATITEQARTLIEETATIRRKIPIGGGLTALVLETNTGSGLTVFVDPSGRYLIAGAVIDSQTGENIAERITRTHFPEPGPDQMYAEAEELAWVRTGRAGRGEPIYIVADTQCGYCHQMAREIAARGIQREIRWVLVGFGGSVSMRQAAGVLAIPDQRRRTSAFWALVTGQASGAPDGVSTADAARVAANESWAEKWRVTGTPVTLIPHEGQIHRVIGLPNAALWDIIGGI